MPSGTASIAEPAGRTPPEVRGIILEETGMGLLR